jgi:hypothetical protein
MSKLSNLIFLTAAIFVFAVYVMVVAQIIIDLFRDPELGAGAKALWIIGLIFVPLVTAVLYVALRGQAMARRTAVQRARDKAELAFGDTVSTSSVDVIARAKSLLDAGVITNDEFATIKRTALASPQASPA